jgi:hypothetical protein
MLFLDYSIYHFNRSLKSKIWGNDRWCWKLQWRRQFFLWEEELFKELLDLIALVPITKETDSWSFQLEEQFSVSSLYLYLYNRFIPPSNSGLNSLGMIAKVWGSWAPTKVIVFSWQALLGRLPTRENLARRGVDCGGAVGCVLCGGGRETEDHLFATCSTAWEVWSKVHRWFGVATVVPSSIGSMFQCFLPLFRNRKYALKGINLIWHAVLWVFWRTRNERIFRGIVVRSEEIFDRDQVVSWKWLLAKKATSPCLFYMWCIEPFDCIVR